MTTRRSTIAVSGALALGLLVSGCAGTTVSRDGTASSATEASTEAPAPKAPTGPTVSGTGYSFAGPEGWEEPEQEIPGFDPDALVMDLADADGFSDNINVVVSPMTPPSLDVLEESVMAEAAAAGFENTVLRDRVRVAGEDTATISAVATALGQTYNVDQIYPTNGSSLYVVTLSTSVDVPEETRTALIEGIAASWSWS